MGTETAESLRPTPAEDPFFYGWRYVTKVNDDGTNSIEQVPLTEQDVLHPQEGDFIVNNHPHNLICEYLKQVFRDQLENQPDALVLGDHLIDWQAEGIRALGPDVAVIRDAPSWYTTQGTFRVRDHNARIPLVIEVTSASTRFKDLTDKVDLYYRVGVPRYIIIDLQESDEEIVLHFYVHRPTPEGPVRQNLPDPSRVWLPELNLWLAIDGDRIVCLEHDGTPIRDYTGVSNLAKQEKARAEQEKARAEAAEARVRELEEQLKRRNSSQP